jgi:hypothetical protein
VTREDLQSLRTPLIALGLTLVAAFVLVFYSAAVADRAHARFQRTEVDLKQARLRIQNAGEEKDMIGRYLGGYQQLEKAGFVGDEQRINWLDALRVANQQANIFGVEYEITAQRPYAYAAEFNPGPLALKESVMRLKLRLLHEEDLPRFLQTLARQGGGFFNVDQCVVRRVKAGEAEVAQNVQPNLLAECELSWLTVKPAAAAEKKG